ncbi:hypothetical protein [Brachybacterium alimentarium]|uniref:hypothetical protein n=1 Tax=Brachybacterium alimentarium TaxID=47845 RepID=UPI003FD17E5C
MIDDEEKCRWLQQLEQRCDPGLEHDDGARRQFSTSGTAAAPNALLALLALLALGAVLVRRSKGRLSRLE